MKYTTYQQPTIRTLEASSLIEQLGPVSAGSGRISDPATDVFIKNYSGPDRIGR